MPWAIQRISDGAFLPLHKRGHFSRTEIGDYGPPRLFATKNGAQVSMHNWCSGYWHTEREWESTNEYGDGYYVQGLPVPIGKGARDKNDYRVVEVQLIVKDEDK